MILTRAFYLHNNVTQIVEHLDGIVYHYDNNDILYVMGFSGKRAKPDYHSLFKDSEQW